MKTIWAIIAGLGVMLILSIVMVFVTMPQPRRQQISHVAMPVPCNCRGQCIRRK